MAKVARKQRVRGSPGGAATGDALGSQAQRLLETSLELTRYVSLQDPLAELQERADLSRQQVGALMLLARAGSQTVGEFGRRLGVSHSRATRLADALEGRGLLERERDEDDRRVVRLVLASDGQRIIAQVNDAMLARTRELIEPLTDRERERFVKTMATVVSAHRARGGAKDKAAAATAVRR